MTIIEREDEITLADRTVILAELAADRAAAAEAARTPDASVINAVLDAGFARHFASPEFGGVSGSFTDLTTAATVLGARCPATAWSAVLAALMARAACALPLEGQMHLWGNGPDVLIAGGLLPKGIATQVRDGWLLSGVWPTVSTSECADWVLLAATVDDMGPQPERICLVPQSDIGIERTWDSVGMRATGSHTVVADRLLVPDFLTFPADALTNMESPPLGPDGRSVPILAVNSLAFCLPILGAARGVLQLWQQIAAERDLTHAASTFTRAASEIDAAGLLLERIAQMADSAPRISQADIVRNRRDCAFAADLLLDAVDRLFRASGSRGHSASTQLQRLWRDAHTAGSHAALQFGPAAAIYAEHTWNSIR